MPTEREVKRRAQSGWHSTNMALVRDMPKKPERNWAALIEAALKPAIGYWRDAPYGPKFSGGDDGESANGRPAGFEPAREGSSPSSPATSAPRPADVWPKWMLADGRLWRFDSSERGSGDVYSNSCSGAFWRHRADYDLARAIQTPEALAWLRANGHAAEAEKWEPKPATIRAWKDPVLRARVWDGAVMWNVYNVGRATTSTITFAEMEFLAAHYLEYAELPADEAIRLNEERLKCQAKPA